MNGFWLPVLIIILQSGEPQLLYDANRNFSGQATCLAYSEAASEKLPPEIGDLVESSHFSCIWVPDSRGI